MAKLIFSQSFFNLWMTWSFGNHSNVADSLLKKQKKTCKSTNWEQKERGRSDFRNIS